MGKRMWAGVALVMVATQAGAGGGLTDTEQRWIDAGRPVVSYAKRQGLPLDIIVQPDEKPGDAPLAMAYVDGRCKLVLTLRGRPAAETEPQGIAPGLHPVVIEAMTAHEIGHCWRYVHGAWHTLPAGFVDAANGRADDDAALRDMRDARREEGFADLVGLAWVHAQYPQHYAAVQAWFEKVRDDGPGEHHDTRAWLHLVRDAAAFPSAATPFDQVRGLWQQGLLSGD
jgi:hypothetical protein